MNDAHSKDLVGNHIGAFAAGAYTVPGSSIDWALSRGVIFSYVFEIYGTESAHRDDCFNMFNPITKWAYHEELQRWAHAFLTIADAMHEDLSSTDSSLRSAKDTHVNPVYNGGSDPPPSPSVPIPKLEPNALPKGSHGIRHMDPMDHLVASEGFPGGLIIKRVKVASGSLGRRPNKGDHVSVQYTGVLASTGKEFDSSWGRDKPVSFTLGIGEVIRGWDAGVATMRVGEKAQLYVPARMAYGARGAGGESIPPHSDLEFELELISAEPTELSQATSSSVDRIKGGIDDDYVETGVTPYDIEAKVVHHMALVYAVTALCALAAIVRVSTRRPSPAGTPPKLRPKPGQASCEV